MLGGFVADQSNGPQCRHPHVLRLLASGELPLFLEATPGPVRFLQLPLDVAVQLQLLVPHPAHEIDAIVLFELAEKIRPPIAAIHQQNLQPLPQRPHGLVQACQQPAQHGDFAFLQPAQNVSHHQFAVVLDIQQD